MSLNVIVVGAGITGVCTAEWLRRAGADVTLIDRVNPGDPAQTSYGNAGLLARCAIIPVSVPGLTAKAPKMLLDPKSPLFMKWGYLPKLLPWLVPFLRNGRMDRLKPIVKALDQLTHDSVDQHMALAKGTPAEKFIRTGDYIYVYKDRAAFEADGLGMGLRREHGFEIEEINGAELHERDPHLSDAYNFGANFPDHGWIGSPGKYVQALARHFTDNGGTFLTGEVDKITNEGVRLKDGTGQKADKIVVATGAWSKDMTRQLGDKINLETERGYHLFLKDPNFLPPVPYMIADGKFAATPMDDGLRLAGTVEFGGLDAPASDAPTDLLREHIKRVYPDLKWTIEEKWLGHRPSTSDSLPVLSRSKNAPNVIYAFGSQHVGLTIGPRLGRMAMDMVMDVKTNTDLTPYRADRF